MTKLSNDINLNDLSNGAEKDVRWLKAAFLVVMSHSFPV